MTRTTIPAPSGRRTRGGEAGGARAMSRLSAAVALGLAATGAAQALTPASVICPALFGDHRTGGPEPLGGGLLASSEWGPIAGLGEGLHEIVTHCASGQSIITDLAPAERVVTSDEVRAIAREAAASPQVMSLDDLAARLSAAVGPSLIRESRVENSECLCLLAHPDPARAGDR